LLDDYLHSLMTHRDPRRPAQIHKVRRQPFRKNVAGHLRKRKVSMDRAARVQDSRLFAHPDAELLGFDPDLGFDQDQEGISEVLCREFFERNRSGTDAHAVDHGAPERLIAEKGNDHCWPAGFESSCRGSGATVVDDSVDL
jgi:hypothetical protein